MKNYSIDEKKEILEQYFSKYGYAYEPNIKEYIYASFCMNNRDCMTQIYQAMGMYSDLENPYIGFADIIGKKFGLDIDILEIGGGVYPALTDVISKRQVKIGKGTITVYDPYLASEKIKLERATLKKTEFTDKQDVSKYDLIIGKEPCAATYDIIKVARDSGKNYLLSPCSCYGMLPDFIEYNADPVQQWYDFVKELCDVSEIDVETHYLPKVMKYEAPIYTVKHY